jgi:hypothetical protein
MRKCLFRQREACLVRQAAAGLQLVQHWRIVLGVGDDADAALLVAVILGRRAHHGRAADVDVLDGVIQRAARLGHRLAEGIEVHHHQVDRRDAVLRHHRQVLGQVAPTKDAAMHLGVQGLDAAVEHLGEAGVVGNIGDLQAGIAQQLGGAAGGQQLDPSWARPRAKSTAPRLSETLSSACVTFMETSQGLKQFVFDQHAAQGAAADAQHFGSDGLVAVGLLHHDFQHRSLDALQQHVIDGMGRLAVEIAEIAVQGAPHAVVDLAAHAAFIAWVSSR